MASDPWYRQLNRKDWKAFFASWLGYLLDGFDFVLITLVLTEIQDDLGLSGIQAATLISAAFLSRWIGGITIGAAADRFGRKNAMVISIVLFAVGTGACGFAWDFVSLFIARLVVGLGMAGEYTASANYIIESWPQGLRNRASGFMLSGYGVGLILASQVYAWIVPSFGWRALFWIGLVPVAVAFWLRRVLPEAKDWERDVAGRPVKTMFGTLYLGRRAPWNWALTAAISVALYLLFATSAGWAAVPLGVLVVGGFVAFLVQFAGRQSPLLLTVMLIVFCAFLYSWPIQSLLPTFLKDELGYSPGAVAAIVFWSGIGRIAGNWFSGFAGDWFGTRWAYSMTLLASIPAIIPLFFLGPEAALLLGIVLFVQQGLSQGISGILPKYITSFLSTEVRGAGLGYLYNVGAFGGALAPVITTRLAESYGLGASLAGVTAVLSLVTAVLVACNVPYLVQRWTRGRRDGSPEATVTAAD